jgi:Spy/CpxP family protein refolding chaperone
MHPGFISWWKHAHRASACGARAGCGPAQRSGDSGDETRFAGGDYEGHFGGGGFGVRRPLRFLAVKLELEEDQVTELASILSELKTERAQADVDQRRSTSTFADVMAAPSFDEAKVDSAGAERVKSAERLRAAITRTLSRIHAILDDDQRKRFAYLLRTGAIVI